MLGWINHSVVGIQLNVIVRTDLWNVINNNGKKQRLEKRLLKYTFFHDHKIWLTLTLSAWIRDTLTSVVKIGIKINWRMFWKTSCTKFVKEKVNHVKTSKISYCTFRHIVVQQIHCWISKDKGNRKLCLKPDWYGDKMWKSLILWYLIKKYLFKNSCYIVNNGNRSIINEIERITPFNQCGNLVTFQLK